MAPTGSSATARVRLALAVLVPTAVGWLLPWLTAASVDAPSLLLVTLVA